MPKRKLARDECVNCGVRFEGPKPALFCSELCREEADLVRYVRRCRADGRIFRSDVMEAIEIRQAHVLSGGYARLGRTLSEARREEVKLRDRGVCRICGKPGTEIDHVADSSEALDNLQLLCHDCHMEKTMSRLVRIMPDDPNYAEISAQGDRLRKRYRSKRPQRICDDHEKWPTVWRSLLSSRRA